MLTTIYGKREGYGMSYFRDKACRQFLCHNPYEYHRRGGEIMLNCARYYLVVVR